MAIASLNRAADAARARSGATQFEPCGGGRDRGTVAVEDRFKDLTGGLGLDALLEPLGMGVVGVAGIHNVDVVLVASSRHGHVELLP